MNIRNQIHDKILTSRIMPALLFTVTACTMILGGSWFHIEENDFILMIVKGLPFALCVFCIVSAHSMGHYITAKKYGIRTSLPYYLPGILVFGTLGAFIRIKWPINNRKALFNIYTLGPICGFLASWIIFTVGLHHSEVKSVADVTGPNIAINNSIITYLTELAVIGKVPDADVVVWHPIAVAGWMGLYYNLWHLFPIGKLDGGRIIYGLFGYNKTRFISYGTILILVVLSFLWFEWIYMAIFGLLCMINFRDQYSLDNYTDALDNTSKTLCLVTLILLIVSFAPVPLK